MDLYGAASAFSARFNAFWAIGNKVSFINVDLPEPETPVIQVNKPTGISKLTFFRLLPDAPNNLSVFFLSSAVRFFGISIFSAPDKNLPVSEFGFCMICCAVPSAMTLPPCTPAPGPMSIMWSALKIASSSCSTTITVLPRFRKWIKVLSKRSLSRWCNPIDGSSNTYITPTKPAPIWLARRMRCASPPERVSAERERER